MARDFHRRSSLRLSSAELNKYFQVLVEAFNEEWLNKKRPINPIQELWQRNEELSTNELYTLAYSIERLSKIDRNWTRQQIKMCKSHDLNNSKGAVFELHALSMMHATQHCIKPAKLNQAGYDGTWHILNDKEIRISIKNYGTSNAQR